MTATNIENGLEQLPLPVFSYLRRFLLNEIHYKSLQKYLRRSSLVLEKDGYQIPLNSEQELELTKELLEKIADSKSAVFDTATH